MVSCTMYNIYIYIIFIEGQEQTKSKDLQMLSSTSNRGCTNFSPTGGFTYTFDGIGRSTDILSLKSNIATH